MVTEEYLGQLDRLDKMIQNKVSEIYQLKTMVCSVNVSNDSERVQTSSDKDKLGSMIAKIVDLEREAYDLIDSFIEKRNHIIKQIEGMEDVNMYQVLYSRYIGKKKFSVIAHEMNYSLMQIKRIRDKALLEFEKRYGQEYLNENLL